MSQSPGAIPQLDLGDAEGLTVGIVAARWHSDILDTMLNRAVETATAVGARPEVIRVAGTMELPVVAQELARTYDAVVALGVVIRGATAHFDYVCDSVTQGLTRVALDEATPVGNAVLTVDTVDQAIDRSGAPGATEDKGHDATMAALDVACTLRRLRASRGAAEAAR